jgi:hypothetical protein
LAPHTPGPTTSTHVLQALGAPPVPTVEPPIPTGEPPTPTGAPPVPTVEPPIPTGAPPVPTVEPPMPTEPPRPTAPPTPTVEPPLPTLAPPVPAPPFPAIEPPGWPNSSVVRTLRPPHAAAATSTNDATAKREPRGKRIMTMQAE